VSLFHDTVDVTQQKTTMKRQIKINNYQHDYECWRGCGNIHPW